MSGTDVLSCYLTDDDLYELVSVFPDVEFAFAYGSGVIEQEDSYVSNSILSDENCLRSLRSWILYMFQKGYARHVAKPQELPMLDLVLGVSNSEKWHRINLERNPSHYSGFAQLIGARGVAYIQEQLGAKLYYNPLVPMPATSHRGRLMKYGVINMHHLKTDLTDWTWLYAAGRLHKPVRVMKKNEKTSHLVQGNLASAVKTALLLLPETFSASQLYTTIAGLSYTGDIRMHFAENPDKVKNMVSTSLERFEVLYEPVIKDIPGLSRGGYGSSSFGQDKSLSARIALAEALPASVRSLLTLSGGGWSSNSSRGAEHVSRALAAVVARSSLRQGAKGLLTAGVVKSASYSMAKISSAIAGRRKRLTRSSLSPKKDDHVDG